MIYVEPKLEAIDFKVLNIIKAQRERLRIFTENTPNRWLGSLRKSTFARAIRGSNSIEGYNASMDDAMAAVENEGAIDDDTTETWQAINGYRDAMTYILQTSKDSYFEFSKQFLKSLHFMMIGYDLSKYPGQWRPGTIFVVDKENGDVVYNAPDAEHVDVLINELVEYIKSDHTESIIVKAAMAHLNLTMIHPFKDGNGRMARALQTLLLAQDGIVHPLFSSIEEWLGRNTNSYYNILGEVGQGSWNPSNDALPWIRFCLKAHHQQAATLIRRNEEYGIMFEKIEALMEAKKLPERTGIPLFEAALGLRLTNTRYRIDTEVSEFVASRELKRLCEEGLLDPKGQNRGRTYVATEQLKDIRETSRIERPIEDPYSIIEQEEALREQQAQLSLLDSQEESPD